MTDNYIFDTHAHYDDEAFDGDRDILLSSFPEKGIGRVINVAASVKSNKEITALTERYPFIYGTAGVHPDNIEELNEDAFKEIAGICDREKTVAVGEIGLDYYWHDDNKPQQKYWFERFAHLAKEKQLPVSIHSRDAAADTLDMVRSCRMYETGAVMHCYSYSRELAREYLDMGMYFGIGGVSTFKNARKLVETIEYLPMSAILLETDCPYLAPVPYRGKRNCSLYLEHVAKRISQLKGITPEEVIRITRENAGRLFKKVKL